MLKMQKIFFPNLNNLILLGHALGRDSFLENETIYPVARLFDDKEDIARKNAHLCVMRISETPPGWFF